MSGLAFRYQVGGSLPIEFPGYVERSADKELVNHLLRGETCFVFNSRQMGKSSLKVRAIRRLQAEGRLCAVIDPQGRGTKVTEEQWYAGTVKRLIEDFDLEDQLPYRNWWTERADPSVSPSDRFFDFIAKELLPATTAPLVIFVEEVDNLLSLQFDTNGFFSLIRSLHERRADQPIYRRLCFALLGVATPYDLIQGASRGSFNIGYAVELTGFTLEEARPLLAGLQGRVAEPEAALAAVLQWSGGQPFLTQKLLSLLLEHPQGEISTKDWVGAVVQHQVIDAWEANDEPIHLRHIRDRLLLSDKRRRGQLLAVVQRILKSKQGIHCQSSREQMLLRLSGLAVPRGGMLQIYNPIYASVFNQNWVSQKRNEVFPFQAIPALTAGLLSLFFLTGLIWWQWENRKSTLVLLEDYCQSLSKDLDPNESCGAKNLMKNSFPDKGVIEGYFNAKQYPQAIAELKRMLDSKDQNANPSHLIAFNNAKILSRATSDPVYVIAISLPFEQSVEFIATSLLAGVAEAQDNHNQQTNTFKLFIVLANDENQPKTAEMLASRFSQKRFISALFSSYSSELTFAHLKALQGQRMPLLSATSTASRRSFGDEYFRRFHQELDTSWFFRSVSTTETGAEHLVSQIAKNARINQGKILLFYQQSDLFSKSYLHDFEANIIKAKLTIDERANLDSISESAIQQVIKKFQEKHHHATGKNIIVIIPDAFRERAARKKIGAILDGNTRGEFLVFGSNTLYGEDILLGDPDLKIVGVRGNPSIGSAIIANVPWIPDEKSQQTYRWSGGKFGWHHGTAYDATTMLLQAITNLDRRNEIVSRENLAAELASGRIKVNGKTGPFELKRSERTPQTSFLVTPQCVNGLCRWKVIDRLRF